MSDLNNINNINSNNPLPSDHVEIDISDDSFRSDSSYRVITSSVGRARANDFPDDSEVDEYCNLNFYQRKAVKGGCAFINLLVLAAIVGTTYVAISDKNYTFLTVPIGLLMSTLILDYYFNEYFGHF